MSEIAHVKEILNFKFILLFEKQMSKTRTYCSGDESFCQQSLCLVPMLKSNIKMFSRLPSQATGVHNKSSMIECCLFLRV